MAERRVLSTWKEIASYMSRGVRTVQRWETNYRLPVRRAGADAQSVFAFADEIDAWLERSKPRQHPYVRPTFLVVDVVTPNALSDLKLILEVAKFNVITAFTSDEALATARKYDVDGFVIDSVLLDAHPGDLARELRRLYPSKVCVLVGDEQTDCCDVSFPAGNPGAIVDWLIKKFGNPQSEDIASQQ
jgi:hypothetical protein